MQVAPGDGYDDDALAVLGKAGDLADLARPGLGGAGRFGRVFRDQQGQSVPVRRPARRRGETENPGDQARLIALRGIEGRTVSVRGQKGERRSVRRPDRSGVAAVAGIDAVRSNWAIFFLPSLARSIFRVAAFDRLGAFPTDFMSVICRSISSANVLSLAAREGVGVSPLSIRPSASVAQRLASSRLMKVSLIWRSFYSDPSFAPGPATILTGVSNTSPFSCALCVH